MHDPMALVTDSALAVVAWVLAALLYRARKPWPPAFVFTGIAAFLGGIYHGLFEHPTLWKATVYAVGLASFFLLFGSGGRGLRAFAAVKLAAYLIWMSLTDGFLWVIVDYGVTLLIVFAVHAMRKSPATKWIGGSIAVSIVGALVQQTRVTIDPYWFDFNDLYHLIQMGALWMLYRAGMLRA